MKGQPSPYSQARKSPRPFRAALGKQHRWRRVKGYFCVDRCEDCGWERIQGNGFHPRYYERGASRWEDLSVAGAPPCLPLREPTA